MNTEKRDYFIEKGGKLWEAHDKCRVYLDAEIFNEEVGTRFGDNNNKFFYDCDKNALMRSYKGKKPQIEVEY